MKITVVPAVFSYIEWLSKLHHAPLKSLDLSISTLKTTESYF